MTTEDTRLPIDPRNPGQAFACFGLAELCGRLDPASLFSFDLAGGEFVLRGPLASAVEKLADPDARIERARKHNAQAAGAAKDDPVVLSLPGMEPIRLNWWLTPEEADTVVRLKTWAGPRDSAEIFQGMLQDAREILQKGGLDGWTEVEGNRPSLGVDPSTAWTARNVGFSPHAAAMTMPNHPVVELLASIGLGWSRLMNARGRMGYALWLRPLPLPSARLAAAGWLPVEGKRYEFGFELRGKNKNFEYATEEG